MIFGNSNVIKMTIMMMRMTSIKIYSVRRRCEACAAENKRALASDGPKMKNDRNRINKKKPQWRQKQQQLNMQRIMKNMKQRTHRKRKREIKRMRT